MYFVAEAEGKVTVFLAKKPLTPGAFDGLEQKVLMTTDLPVLLGKGNPLEFITPE